jgi:electron transfer flavoprotein beta subunit
MPLKKILRERNLLNNSYSYILGDFMKFLVTVKRVVDYEAKLKVLQDKSFIETENVNMITNPFDEIGVEAAIQLKEKFGGEIVVVSIGPEEAQQNIRTALAMGADRGILVKHDDKSEIINTEITAGILSAICKEENPDIIIMGKQAIDTDNHQTAEFLAEIMNIGNASQANTISLNEQKNVLTVKKEADGGLETISTPLPAVVTTDLRLNEPRYASLPGIMKAKRKPLKKISLSDLALNTKINFKILEFRTQPERKAGQILENLDLLIDVLKPIVKTI